MKFILIVITFTGPQAGVLTEFQEFDDLAACHRAKTYVSEVYKTMPKYLTVDVSCHPKASEK
jgi:hypothetical protein